MLILQNNNIDLSKVIVYPVKPDELLLRLID